MCEPLELAQGSPRAESEEEPLSGGEEHEDDGTAALLHTDEVRLARGPGITVTSTFLLWLVCFFFAFFLLSGSAYLRHGVTPSVAPSGHQGFRRGSFPSPASPGEFSWLYLEPGGAGLAHSGEMPFRKDTPRAASGFQGRRKDDVSSLISSLRVKIAQKCSSSHL